MLSGHRVRRILDARFAGMLFVWRELELFYFRGLRDAIDTNEEGAKGDQEQMCWFIDNPYTNMYMRRGGTHRTQALKFEICRRTSVRN